MDPPAVTVVVPTRGRAAYLDVTLGSLRDQRTRTTYEVLVIDDGATDATPQVVGRHGATLISHGERRNANAARNTGLSEAKADLIAFLDDDVLVPPGWLDALVRGASRYPDAEAFGGPIHPRLEGHAPRGCGREGPPITALDLGPDDREAEMVWGANFAMRRSAIERIGNFDERRGRLHGDEEDWLLRLRAAGGKIMYLADAGLDHRRDAKDSRLSALARAAYDRGRAARETDSQAGTAPGIAREVRILLGCGWHTVRRACPQGVIMGAHAAGRLTEALAGSWRVVPGTAGTAGRPGARDPDGGAGAEPRG